MLDKFTFPSFGEEEERNLVDEKNAVLRKDFEREHEISRFDVKMVKK